MAFSPDERRFASADGSGTIRLWDAQTGRSLFTLKGHTEAVTCLAFSPEGKYVVSGSADKTVRVWATATGASVRKLDGHDAPVRALAVTADGRRMVSVSKRSLLSWEVGNWAKTDEKRMNRTRLGGVLSGTSGRVSSLPARPSFTPDARQLIVGSATSPAFRIYDVTTGKRIKTFRGETSSRGFQTITLSPDGKRIVAGGSSRARSPNAAKDFSIKVIDIEAGKTVLSLDGHGVVTRALAVSPDGRWITSGGDDGAIIVWDAETGRKERTFKPYTRPVFHLAFSRDGSRLASSDGSDVKLWNTRLWSRASGEATVILKERFSRFGDSVHSVAFQSERLECDLGCLQQGQCQRLGCEIGRAGPNDFQWNNQRHRIQLRRTDDRYRRGQSLGTPGQNMECRHARAVAYVQRAHRRH